MIYVDSTFGLPSNRISIEDDNAVEINIIKGGEIRDWGDEDVIKNVKDVYECDITFKPSVAHLLRNIDKISMLRWNYYMPCYNIISKNQTNEKLSDGTLVFHIR